MIGRDFRLVPYPVYSVMQQRVPGALQLMTTRVNAALAGIPASAYTLSSYWRGPSHQELAVAARTASGLRVMNDSPVSQHMLGTAIDISRIDPRWRARIKSNLQQVGMAWVCDETDHIHAQLFPRGVLDNLGVYRQLGFA